MIFIHIQTSLKKIPHFLYYWFGGKNFYPSSKSGNPRKESGADFDGGGDGEMLGIHRKHLNVLAKLVNDGIGLGEAVASLLGEKLPTPIRRIGVNDEFGHSGPAAALLKQFGLSSENIINTARFLCAEGEVRNG